MTTKQKITYKIRSLILCLEAHPDYEPDSEFADRLSDLRSLQEDIEEYATEAIKADRERVAQAAKVKTIATPVGDYHEIDKESILNLPIELP